jgi:hypothetical protein
MASIYKICVFGADRKSNMAARAYNVFWLVEILKIFLRQKQNLVYDHPMNISAKFGSNLFCGFRKKDENVKFPFHLFFWNHKTDLNQTWQKCSLDGHIQDFVFGAGEIPIGSNVKLSRVMVAILNFRLANDSQV